MTGCSLGYEKEGSARLFRDRRSHRRLALRRVYARAATPHQRLLLDRQSSVGNIAQMNESQTTESSLFGVSTIAFVSVEIRGLQGIHA